MALPNQCPGADETQGLRPEGEAFPETPKKGSYSTVSSAGQNHPFCVWVVFLGQSECPGLGQSGFICILANKTPAHCWSEELKVPSRPPFTRPILDLSSDTRSHHGAESLKSGLSWKILDVDLDTFTISHFNCCLKTRERHMVRVFTSTYRGKLRQRGDVM